MPNPSDLVAAARMAIRIALLRGQPAVDRVAARLQMSRRSFQRRLPLLAKGATKTARLWTYVRDDRPFAGGTPPAALFYFSRDREMAQRFGASSEKIEREIEQLELALEVAISSAGEPIPDENEEDNAEARAKGQFLPDARAGREGWTSRDKHAAAIETASMNEADLGEYCRRRDIYPEQLGVWREACEGSNDWEPDHARDEGRQEAHPAT